MKNVDQLARSRAKDHRTSLLGPFIETQHRVLGMRARSLWPSATAHSVLSPGLHFFAGHRGKEAKGAHFFER